MKNAIDIKGVSKAYRDFTLDSLTLSLPEGSIMGLIGENGAGKSTTIKLIMNAILPDSGSIEVLGMDNKSPRFAEAKMFTIRKISNGIGVERIFPLYSPHIESIEVNKQGVVRRARIYYLRNLTGKKARIKEKRAASTK